MIGQKLSKELQVSFQRNR